MEGGGWRVDDGWGLRDGGPPNIERPTSNIELIENQVEDGNDSTKASIRASIKVSIKAYGNGHSLDKEARWFHGLVRV